MMQNIKQVITKDGKSYNSEIAIFIQDKNSMQILFISCSHLQFLDWLAAIACIKFSSASHFPNRSTITLQGISASLLIFQPAGFTQKGASELTHQPVLHYQQVLRSCLLVLVPALEFAMLSHPLGLSEIARWTVFQVLPSGDWIQFSISNNHASVSTSLAMVSPLRKANQWCLPFAQLSDWNSLKSFQAELLNAINIDSNGVDLVIQVHQITVNDERNDT